MKVLLAISDRLFGDAILRFAASHNPSGQTEYKIVSVISPKATQPGKNSKEREAYYACEKRHSDTLLTQGRAMLLRERPEAKVSCEVLEGHTARELLSCAQEWPADMIVMGSHGRHGLERALLGSVSFYVSSHSPCSVSIVRVSTADILDFDLDESDVPDEMKSYVEA